MDKKITKYKQIVRQLISDLGERRSKTPYAFLKYHAIIDDNIGHYLLLRTGWKDSDRYYSNLVHIEVRDTGRVWLHEDRTDFIIADMLIAENIPESDIVLGFYPPIMREDTEFAVR